MNRSQNQAFKNDKVISDVEVPRTHNILGLRERHYNWLILTAAHVFGLYYTYLTWSGHVKRNTFPFELFYSTVGILGITVGCHRYWTHKTFKATLPLQVILMIMQTIAGQAPIYNWCLNHRIHHKYTDTNSDPHNSRRGLLFSHIGWLYLPKHPDYIGKLKTFDMPDLRSDPIVRFQKRWYWVLVLIFHTALPVAFLCYFYQLPLFYAVACNYRRYILCLHFTWSVNSIAHKFGDKPYDRNITSVENAFVSFVAVGEGWHNYHHTFPWDYKASEFGWKINLSTMFIDLFAWLGWAYDMKTVSQRIVRERLSRCSERHLSDSRITEDDDDNRNDSDFHVSHKMIRLMKNMDHPVWGWDDENMTDEFKSLAAKVVNPKDGNH